jgi:transcriptional regulator with XRE-family HTH domain/nucleoside 2-deoxyribosyltransferase
MVKPDNVEGALKEHFEQVTLDDFKERYSKSTGGNAAIQQWEPTDSATRDVILTQMEAAPLPLNAYLASALTGLSDEEREHLFAVSHLATTVCEELGIEVYEPRKSTDPVKHPDVPSGEVFEKDRERVLSSDLVIHIADYASTGAGEELDFALAALIPIVLISRGDSVVSRMVLGIPALKLHVTYHTLEDLKVELRQRLSEIRPILEERKLSFSEFDNNIVGNKIRLLREQACLTREELAINLDGLLTVDRLRAIEDSNDKVSNPSLLELRSLSALLKTTVADLVEPDLGERIYVLLQEWLDGQVAARYGMSRNDRNKIISRILLRVIDDLQRE